MICGLIAREKFKSVLEFQVCTSCSYQALCKHENTGYVEVTEDHLYNTQKWERSDEVSPYLMSLLGSGVCEKIAAVVVVVVVVVVTLLCTW